MSTCCLTTLLVAATLADGSHLVHVEGEVHAVLQTDERWMKPFLYPVLRPGWSENEPRPGRYVAFEDCKVAGEMGETVATLSSASTVAVTRIENREKSFRMYTPDLGGWVNGRSLAPVSALAVREMSDTPLPRDRRSADRYDHPHHRGIWVALDSVNGHDWWGEKDRIRNRSVTVEEEGRLAVENDWLDDAGVPLIAETQEWIFLVDGGIDVTIKLAAASGTPVVFGDTKEGLLGVRVPDLMRAVVGGRLINSDGRVGEDKVWGQAADWTRYEMTSDPQPFAITLEQDAENPRRSRFHARGYGLFAVSPFGPSAYTSGRLAEDPLTLTTGEAINLRYRISVAAAQK